MILKFAAPFESSSPRLDGLVFQFPFEVREANPGARKDSVSEHQAEARISGTQLSIWGFDRWSEVPELVAPTLFEYVRDAIFERIAKEEPLTEVEVYLNTQVAENQYPFDKEKLTDPDGAEVELDADELRRKFKLHQPDQEIGFKIQDG